LKKKHDLPVRRVVERMLFAVGFACLAVFAAAEVRAWRFATREGARLDPLLLDATSDLAPAERARAEARPGRAFGRIEFPDRGYAALVAEGIDGATLQLAVGHLPGTAFPGERGNVALAGHRDSFFRVLKDLRPDDLVRFRTPDGVFSYRIEWGSVLEPSRMDVIEPAAGEPLLTLITCYPFGYLGPAPLRYVVRARQIRLREGVAANPL
jgi:sortase A